MKIGKNSEWLTSIPHPVLQGKRLHFFADPPHILKNVRAALCSGKTIHLPDDFVRTWNLPSSTVTFNHLMLLCRHQENLLLKPAPGLTADHLSPNHFEKMNVAGAMTVFSKSVSAALRHLVQDCGFSTDLLTTAKFIEVFRHWFDLVNSRNPSMALSLTNKEKYVEAVSFIESVIDLFDGLSSSDFKWKPWQTAVVTTSKSILSMANQLLEEENFEFFLTSRVSQDSLENTFSMIRLKNPTPTPKEFKYNLRAICAAQYMKEKKSSNYEHDEAAYLVNCLGDVEKSKDRNGEDEMDEFVRNFTQKLESGVKVSMHLSEEKSLYYLSGYVVQSVMKTSCHCETCTAMFLSRKEDNCSMKSLQKLKEYKEGALVECSEKAFKEIFLPAEAMLRSFDDNHLLQTKDILKKLMESFKKLKPNCFSNCHDFETVVIKKFLRSRLYFIAKEKRLKTKAEKTAARSSKSTEMRRLVKNVK